MVLVEGRELSRILSTFTSLTSLCVTVGSMETLGYWGSVDLTVPLDGSLIRLRLQFGRTLRPPTLISRRRRFVLVSVDKGFREVYRDSPRWRTTDDPTLFPPDGKDVLSSDRLDIRRERRLASVPGTYWC